MSAQHGDNSPNPADVDSPAGAGPRRTWEEPKLAFVEPRLVRQGELRAPSDGIDALTFKKPFSIDAARAADHPDLVPDAARGSRARKRCADALRAYRSQHLPCFRPRTIVFPRIVPQAASEVRQLSRSVALRRLLDQSGPGLFDRSTMPAHLEVLSRLLRQTATYELVAGEDLYRSPHAFIDLLEHAPGAPAWQGSSSN